jgi:hypothetical protein
VNILKSIAAAAVISAGITATPVHADSTLVAEAGQPALQAPLGDAGSAEKEVRIVSFGTRTAVWNTSRSRSVEVTVNYVRKDGEPQSLLFTVGPNQKVPFKKADEGASSRIVAARYAN